MALVQGTSLRVQIGCYVWFLVVADASNKWRLEGRRFLGNLKSEKLSIMKRIILPLLAVLLSGCSILPKSGKNRPYEYGHYPKNYKDVMEEYERYHRYIGCKEGEMIASIGAGNGAKEVAISCVVEEIKWSLVEIDSARLYEFHKVLSYHERLKDSQINAEFTLVIGTETSTTLSENTFDRVLLINVFHELEERQPIMSEIHKLLKPDGQLVIMERMANEPGQIHADCKHPKLVEPDMLNEIGESGFVLVGIFIAEKFSNLKYYTFKRDR